jgi:hypothetical protein
VEFGLFVKKYSGNCSIFEISITVITHIKEQCPYKP